MASTRDKLKELLTALGVTPTEKSTRGLLGELAVAVTAATEGDGIVINVLELPTVTENDNGKVLGVVDGAWAVMDTESFVQDSSSEET